MWSCQCCLEQQNIAAALDAEQYFYARVLGFEPADDIEPTPIDNLPD